MRAVITPHTRYAPHGLTLDRTGGDTLDDVALCDQVEDNHGNDGEQDECHGGAQINSAVTALEVLNVDGDGAILVDIE